MDKSPLAVLMFPTVQIRKRHSGYSVAVVSAGAGDRMG